MKIALAQDWITDNGGGELCLRGLLNLYPKSEILTLIWNEKKVTQFNDTKIITSYLNNYPFAKTKWPYFFPMMPRAVESMDFSKYDIVISNCYSAIKGIVTKPDTLHICYCHTPTRYLWMPYLDKRISWGIKGRFSSGAVHNLRIWDFLAAQRPDIFIANSKNVAERIKKFYSRSAFYIYPPVDISSFEIAPKSEIKDYFLFISRLVPYKKADLVIEAFNELGLPLIVAGNGPEREKLQNLANDNVKILGRVSDEKRKKLLSHCRAFIFPAEEDFGIAPLEAMASGRPVIAYGKGGTLETVVKGKTGEFFYEQSKQALINAVLAFNPENYNPSGLKEHAEKFSMENFKANWKKLIEEKFTEFKENGKIEMRNPKF